MPPIREIVTDALKYWEPRRLVYNAVLAGVAFLLFLILLPDSACRIDWSMFLGVLILAVISNLLYCAAYVPDVFVQVSEFRQLWRRWRWILFLAGTLFAVLLEVPFVVSMLSPMAPNRLP